MRDLLGLDARARDLEVAGWSPTLFGDRSQPAAVASPVDRSSDPAAKVALFRSLFAGRDEIYAERWD